MSKITFPKHKERKAVIKVVAATVKGTVKMTTVFVMSAALLAYPHHNHMNTGAYFVSDIVRSKEAAIFTVKTIIPEIAASVHYELGSIVAYIELPADCGFKVEDILVSTIRLYYNGHVTDVLADSARIEGNVLIVEFDWNIVEKWLEGLEPADNPKFKVTGEGISKTDGMRFTFSAQNIVEINLEEVIEIAGLEIRGPEAIDILPEEDNTEEYDCVVFDQEGAEIPDQEVEWSVSGSGVSIDENGQLTVSSGAEAGLITITAVAKSNPDVKGTLDVELVAPEEEPPAEQEEITVPDEYKEEDPIIIDEEDDGTTDDGAVDDGTTDDGAVDDGTTDDGAVDDGTTDDGAADDGTTDDGTVDDGTTDDGAVDDGTTDDGAVDDGTTDDGAVDDGTTDDGAVDDGTTDDGTVDDGTTDDGAADDGTTDDGAVDDGTTDDGAVDDGTTDDGAADDGTTDDGAVDDGTTDDGTVDDSTTDDGTGGDVLSTTGAGSDDDSIAMLRLYASFNDANGDANAGLRANKVSSGEWKPNLRPFPELINRLQWE